LAGGRSSSLSWITPLGMAYPCASI
jgi:hypothetical protein